jgi:aminopeptidase N
MIGVIIHEVGHNFFPMIVNSDERQWSWMDEGLNTFCQYLAEKEWDKDYPARRGEPQDIVPYMKTDKTQQVPIMSSSDNIMAFGPNAYAKPATGLNMLRETIMGRELFDAAFKEYARRWAFKSPMPADFFRTMEDASGVDLDWFWKGWFYGTGNIDLGINAVVPYNGKSLAILSNKGDFPMPVLLEITYTDDTKERVMLPVEIWQRGDNWNHLIQSTKTVKSVVIDPDKILPDINLGNDNWPQLIYDK